MVKLHSIPQNLSVDHKGMCVNDINGNWRVERKASFHMYCGISLEGICIYNS